jgi:putative membrane protein
MPSIEKSDFRTALCGLLMGAADIVPGVSGGTVALVLGIYNRLVSAISRFDRQALGMLTARRWTAAAEHVDLRFVVALGCGIATGIGGLSFVMKKLLDDHLQPTYAVFFGLILGSGVLVARGVARWNPANIAALIAGVAVAWLVVGLDALQSPPDTLWYLFFCGTVGICAMILPGLSGAFILLILGRYSHVTGLIRSILKGDWSVQAFVEVSVFCCGCLFGLLAFSRVLRWLLSHHATVTMATLCGLMLGSLRKLWPFKNELTPPGTEFKLKQFENIAPDFASGATITAVGLTVFAMIAVLSLEAIARKRQPATNPETPV